MRHLPKFDSMPLPGLQTYNFDFTGGTLDGASLVRPDTTFEFDGTHFQNRADDYAIFKSGALRVCPIRTNRVISDDSSGITGVAASGMTWDSVVTETVDGIVTLKYTLHGTPTVNNSISTLWLRPQDFFLAGNGLAQWDMGFYYRLSGTVGAGTTVDSRFLALDAAFAETTRDSVVPMLTSDATLGTRIATNSYLEIDAAANYMRAAIRVHHKTADGAVNMTLQIAALSIFFAQMPFDDCVPTTGATSSRAGETLLLPVDVPGHYDALITMGNDQVYRVDSLDGTSGTISITRLPEDGIYVKSIRLTTAGLTPIDAWRAVTDDEVPEPAFEFVTNFDDFEFDDQDRLTKWNGTNGAYFAPKIDIDEDEDGSTELTSPGVVAYEGGYYLNFTGNDVLQSSGISLSDDFTSVVVARVNNLGTMAIVACEGPSSLDEINRRPILGINAAGQAGSLAWAIDHSAVSISAVGPTLSADKFNVISATKAGDRRGFGVNLTHDIPQTFNGHVTFIATEGVSGYHPTVGRGYKNSRGAQMDLLAWVIFQPSLTEPQRRRYVTKLYYNNNILSATPRYPEPVRVWAGNPKNAGFDVCFDLDNLGATETYLDVSVCTGPEDNDWDDRIIFDGGAPVLTAKNGTEYWYSNKISATGLSKWTKYKYRVRSKTADGVEYVGRKQFAKTTTDEAVDMRIGVFSCLKVRGPNELRTMEAMAVDDLDLVILLGDTPYSNITTADPQQFRASNSRWLRSNPSVQNLFATCCVIVLTDDHDSAGGNCKGGVTYPSGDTTEAVWAVMRQVYFETTPHCDLFDPVTSPRCLGQYMENGVVGIVGMDTRSNRGLPGTSVVGDATDSAAGFDQKTPIKNKMTEYAEGGKKVIIICCPTSTYPNNTDNYGTALTEFLELTGHAQTLSEANGCLFILITGDKHYVGFDDGNLTGGIITWMSSPAYHSSPTAKPGAYEVWKWNGESKILIGVRELYVRMDINATVGNVVGTAMGPPFDAVTKAATNLMQVDTADLVT